jgi:hypothetical protein
MCSIINIILRDMTVNTVCDMTANILAVRLLQLRVSGTSCVPEESAPVSLYAHVLMTVTLPRLAA